MIAGDRVSYIIREEFQKSELYTYHMITQEEFQSRKSLHFL